MKIKNKILVLLLSTILIFNIVGCAKCISTEYENVEVNIVEEYYKPSYTTLIYNALLKIPMIQTHSAIYRITVEYNGVKYIISGSDTYLKYKDKINQTAIGKLEIKTYNDGTVRYDIISLE